MGYAVHQVFIHLVAEALFLIVIPGGGCVALCVVNGSLAVQYLLD